MNSEQARESTPVEIPSGVVTLQGDLTLPERAKGIVLFAHGSGSSRFSPRNKKVGASLQARGLGTLLMDLLTAQEESVDMYTRHLRFNISLLADRLTSAVDWLREHSSTRSLPIGVFGASTGSAAALYAAAERPDAIRAVVSRGGRPDLATGVLGAICLPTLLIVGGADPLVIELNREALIKLTCDKELEIIPNAGHLFEEKGALEEVARLTGDWFERYLVTQQQELPRR